MTQDDCSDLADALLSDLEKVPMYLHRKLIVLYLKLATERGKRDALQAMMEFAANSANHEVKTMKDVLLTLGAPSS